jgi:hypothetical protein
MKSNNYYPEDEETLVEPRFNEEAMEAARPVVPLSQVTSADLYAGANARRAGNGWPRGLIIMVAVVAVLAAAAAAAVYRTTGTTAPRAAPQTLSEADDVAAEPETRPRPEAERPAARQAREEVTSAPAETPKEPEPRPVLAAREEPEKRWHKNEEPRGRDEVKAVERARKEEKKEARREEKESERLADKQGEKREETRPRLVGIYTERRKP